MISEVSQGAATIEFPFADSLEKTDDPSILAEVKQMKVISNQEDGLVPKVALKEIFQVSQQAASEFPKRYGLTTWQFFGKDWYSMREVKALHKIERPRGFKGHSMANMVRDAISDARKD
jgi:hypothetical protein